MIIRLNDWQQEIEGDLETILTVIDDKISEQDLLFNNLVIDGVEFDGELTDYINEHQFEISEIKEIEIIAYTKEQVSNYFIAQITEQQNQLMEKTERLSNRFYGENQDQLDWNSLINVLQEMYQLLETATDLDSLQKTSKIDSSVNMDSIQKLNQGLSLFQAAIESKDCIYIGDLLHFELSKNIPDLLKNK